MAQVQQLFLSCVSAEFRSYRELLRHNLRQPNLTVQIQEDFMAGGVPTLDKLDTYIQSCDAVIHLVGQGLGSLARPRSLKYLRTTYPDLSQRFPALKDFLDPALPSLSYTQWEAWLALMHGKKLLVCTPTEETPRETDFSAQPAELELQQQHLDRLRLHEAYPEVEFSNVDQLTWQIQRSINWSYSLSLINLDGKNTKEDPSQPFSQVADIETITLMVQVEDSGETSANGKRYHLTPELYPAELSDLPLACLSGIAPRENIALGVNTSGAGYIGDCLKEWLTAARSVAQEVATRSGRESPPEVVLELFLPADLLMLDCGGLKIRSATRMRPMANSCCFVVRSLERARDQVNSRSALEDKRAAAALLLVTAGPPEALKNDPEAWSAWHDTLYDKASDPATQACIYLPDPVGDDALRQHLINALIDACVPLVLLWPGGQRSAGLATQDRLELLKHLLALDLDALQTQEGHQPMPFHILQANLKHLSVSQVATGRKRLIGVQPASSQAVLLMDVTDHWPRMLATNQPSDQLHAPI